MIDLHCHSTASDGLLAPADVVRRAAEVGLAAVALTDHDSVAGLAEAHSAGAEVGVAVVDGCEFSAVAPWGEIHLLGYLLDRGDASLHRFLEEARRERAARAGAMLDRLARAGVTIGPGELESETRGGAVGRPHIARILKRRGVVGTVQQAFDRYLGHGRPAYVPKQLPSISAVAEQVRRAGGVLSAAHLKQRGTRANLELLRQQGVDAVETRHPGHSADMVATITEAALALEMPRTGGSDWHGEDQPAGTHGMLGSQHVPDEWLEQLVDWRSRHRGGT